MPLPLYLTFDDGPDPEWTPRVLEILERHSAKATFFVLGWRVREQPGIVEDILAGGHRVELHGDQHLDHEVAALGELVDDTQDALDALKDLGIVPQWWRLPFGRSGPSTAALATAHALRIAGWDVDTHDWRGDGWAQQPAQVSDLATNGGVVLLHDAVVPGIGRTDVGNTLEIAEQLILHAERAGTEIAAFPDAEYADHVPDAPRLSPFERAEAARAEALEREATRLGHTPPESAPAPGRRFGLRGRERA
jgi:peptidoglycan/xylan/chitin deacetylase (PgdA/CDA1 family)